MLVPYRALLDGNRPRPWLAAIAAIPLGFLAGAGNEHTGPALALAALACIVIAWRRDRRLPVWSLARLAALVAGIVFLVTAPGQHARYGGLATHHSLFDPLVERGVLGSLAVVRTQIVWATLVTVVLLAAARAAHWPRFGARAIRIAIGCLVLAATMIGTSLLSPKLPTRLLAAPALMIVLAMGVAIVELERSAAAIRIVRSSCAAIGVLVLGYALIVQIVTGIEGRRRMALLESAPRGSVVVVEPYTFEKPRLVSFGDDFRNPRLRTNIAFTLGLERIDWR